MHSGFIHSTLLRKNGNFIGKNLIFDNTMNSSIEILYMLICDKCWIIYSIQVEYSIALAPAGILAGGNEVQQGKACKGVVA